VQSHQTKTIWRRIGIIVLLVPFSFIFPLVLLGIAWLLWTIYEDLKDPSVIPQPPEPVRYENHTDWLSIFCSNCESPAEEQFLRSMVIAFNLRPDGRKLISPGLTLEMQVGSGSYRFDFVANGRQVIEIDGAAWHSSPEQVERDRIRDEYSVEMGYRVLRIPAKVVFNTPQQAVNLVKAALAETPHYTRPVRKVFTEPRKSISQHLNAFAEGVERVNQSVADLGLKQQALADIKLAISTEKMLLEALVAEVENELRIEALEPMAMQNFNDILASLEARSNGEIKPSREEIYLWKNIVKPTPVNDVEIQRQIESEYLGELSLRDGRLAALSHRCTTDLRFAKRFHRKLKETKYPEVEKIVG